MPWDLLGSAGLPFCLLLLCTTETIKYLLRKYRGFSVLWFYIFLIFVYVIEWFHKFIK